MIEQNKRKLNIKKFIANLNFILIFVGYPLIAVFIIPIFGNTEETTRIVTIPYRAITLAIALITLFLHIDVKIKLDVAARFFLFFWILALSRMFYDLEIRVDYSIPPVFRNQIWLTTLGIVIIPMLSIIKSFNNIDLRICPKYIQLLGLITLAVGFISFSEKFTDTDRILGLALDPISFGQLGGVVATLSIYLLVIQKAKKKLLILFYSASILFGIFVSLRTGSRGPILALMFTFICYYAFKSKYIESAALKVIFPFLILLVFSELLIDMIGYISPVFVTRLTDTISGNDMSTINRIKILHWFWNKIQENILTGSQFAQLSNTGYPVYAHNIFLDILLGLGIYGLVLFLYVLIRVAYYTRLLVLSGSEDIWVGLISIQYIILSFFSGAYYSNPVLNTFIILTLLAGSYLHKKRDGYK
jgi:hypothetical protein